VVQDWAPYQPDRLLSRVAYDKLAIEPLDAITSEKIAGFVAKRQLAGLQIASVNRELEVLRRMLHLAQEWGKVEQGPAARTNLARRAPKGTRLAVGRREALSGRGGAVAS
jgi:site-specific recombinase XerC